MKLNLTDVVILKKDIKEHNLKTGDLGVVVEVYSETDFEVEFITADGRTQALVTLNVNDIRKVESNDMVTVRQL